jgi:hypothetical protein
LTGIKCLSLRCSILPLSTQHADICLKTLYYQHLPLYFCTRVPTEKFKEVIQKLQDAFKNPDKPENKHFLDLHRVEPEDFLKKQATEQTQSQGQSQTAGDAKTYTVNPDIVDWGKFERFGITCGLLEKSGNHLSVSLLMRNSFKLLKIKILSSYCSKKYE